MKKNWLFRFVSLVTISAFLFACTFLSCSGGDEPNIEENIIWEPEKNIPEETPEPVVVGPVDGYIDQSRAIKQDLRGTWKVHGEGIKEQIVTLTGEPVTNECEGEEGGEGYAFPKMGYMFADGHTMYIYKKYSGWVCPEKDLFTVFEVMSLEAGKGVLAAHGGMANPGLETIVYIEKLEGDTEVMGKYEYPQEKFDKNDLVGTWVLTKLMALFTEKEMQIDESKYDLKNLTVTFHDDGSITSHLVSQFIQSNEHVYYYGRSFFLYNETLGFDHPLASAISLHEIESVNDQELSMFVWPLSMSNHNEWRLTFRKLE